VASLPHGGPHLVRGRPAQKQIRVCSWVSLSNTSPLLGIHAPRLRGWPTLSPPLFAEFRRRWWAVGVFLIARRVLCLCTGVWRCYSVLRDLQPSRPRQQQVRPGAVVDGRRRRYTPSKNVARRRRDVNAAGTFARAVRRDHVGGARSFDEAGFIRRRLGPSRPVWDRRLPVARGRSLGRRPRALFDRLSLPCWPGLCPDVAVALAKQHLDRPQGLWPVRAAAWSIPFNNAGFTRHQSSDARCAATGSSGCVEYNWMGRACSAQGRLLHRGFTPTAERVTVACPTGWCVAPWGCAFRRAVSGPDAASHPPCPD